MNNVFKKNLIFFILLIACVAVVSGCGRKENKTPSMPSLEKGEEQTAEKPATEKSSEVGEVKTATSSSEVAEIATSTAEVDTSDWKTYRNTEYGFELKYPNTLELNSDNKYVSFHNDCSKLDEDFDAQMQCYFQGDFDITMNDTGTSDLNKRVDEFIEKYNDDFLDGVPLTRIVSRESYLLDNIPATKLEGTTAEGGASLDYIFIVKNNKSYIISYNQHIDSYVKMLSTFKFID